MFTSRRLIAAAALTGGLLAQGFATPPGRPIRGSRHDFNTGSYVDQWGASYTAPNLCAACHAAHKVKRNYPLWGRQDSTATGWIVWNDNGSATSAQQHRNSDGSIMKGQLLDINNEATDSSLVDAAANPTGMKYLSAKELVASGTGLCMSCHDGQTAIGMADDGSGYVYMNPYFRGNWGRDLTDMHPVGRYIPFGVAGWQASNVVAETKGTVGCTSCHSMHSSTKANTIVRAGQPCLA